MSDNHALSWVRITAAFLGLAIAGTPIVAYVWETLNRLLSGHFEAMRLVWSVLAVILLWFFLRWLARFFERWESGIEQGGKPS